MTKQRLGKDGEFLAKVWNWIRQRFQERPLSFSLVAVGLLFLLVIVVNTVRLGDTGFEPKTLWDWMDLLLVPLVLAIGGWWLNKTQKDSEREEAEKNRAEEREIARERREQETLEQYFDRMSKLLLNHALRQQSKAEVESEVQTIARAQTLAVLRNLGPERKGRVIQFLYESQLITEKEAENPAVLLHGASLHGANLRTANLVGANLEKVYLVSANLVGANLQMALLQKAVLHWASLIKADLSAARLDGAWLDMTNLESANLKKATLNRTRLGLAKLAGANLSGANLTGAYLEGANLTGTKYDKDTVWPDNFDPIVAGAILVDDEDNLMETALNRSA